MFLRGAGSQEFSQDNGEFSEKVTKYSSDSIGKIQGDGMRRLYGGGGPFQFSTPANIEIGVYGNFAKVKGGAGDYELGTGSVGWVEYKVDLPYMKYTLQGSRDSGYYLRESVDYVRNFATMKEGSGEGQGWGARWVGWDSSFAAPTADEIRPVNMAVKYYIRAK